MIFCTSHSLKSFIGLSTPFRDNFTGISRTYDGYTFYLRTIYKSFCYSFISIYQIKYTWRKTNLVYIFCNHLHGHRNLLRCFNYKSVSGGQGVRQKPEGNHSWKIKGG